MSKSGEFEGFEGYESVKLLTEAMIAAHKAFQEFISKKGFDAAYFSLNLVGYVLDETFRKFQEVEMVLDCTGWEKFKYPDREEEQK